MANTKGMKTVPPVHRQQGSLPKIGIRPAIDGRRRGVRESLEGQTMSMARAVADLVTKSIRHPCGLPVECVIADTCIGGFAEAARAAEKFSREGVGVSITVTPCWCYGAETMDMDPFLPKAVWGFNGTERPGAVYLAAVLAAHAQKGLPAFGIYGHDVQDAGDAKIPVDVQEKLLQFTRAGLAAASMRGNSYLAMGAVSMGIAGSIVDPRFLEGWLGMRYEMIDMSEFARRIDEKIYDPEELTRALAWVKQNCRGRRGSQCLECPAFTGPERCGLGVRGQDGVDRPGPHGGKPAPCGAWLRGRSAGAQRHCLWFPGPAPVDGSLPERRFPGDDAEFLL